MRGKRKMDSTGFHLRSPQAYTRARVSLYHSIPCTQREVPMIYTGRRTYLHFFALYGWKSQ